MKKYKIVDTVFMNLENNKKKIMQKLPLDLAKYKLTLTRPHGPNIQIFITLGKT